MVPEYKCKTTKEIKIGGKIYNAHFVKDHTKVQAVILEIIDDAIGDSWANLSDWKITFYIMWKRKKKAWECICKDKKYNRYVFYGGFDVSHGLNYLLFKMETKKEQNRVYRKIRIEELKQTIKNSQKKLKRLVGNK